MTSTQKLQTQRDETVEQTTSSRRSVLRTLGIGGAAVVVLGTGGLSYRVYDTAALHPGGGPAYDPWTEWRDIPGPLGAIACAVLAASPHNTQPWAFTIDPAGIDVLAEADRGTGAVDPLGREQYVGLGCALENLVLGARARGLAPAVTLMPDGTKAARVALGTGESTAGPLYDAIGDRHTNRGPYESRPVAVETLDDLIDPTDLPGVNVRWVTAAEPMAALSQLLIDAAEALIADEQQSRDGFVWFRTTHDDIQRHRDGLVLDGQGLGAFKLAVAKLLPASSRKDGDRFWVTQTREVHTATAAAYGVITSRAPDDRRTQLTAGRMLQRIHLAATSRGIALQHMNQVTERIDRETTTGATATFGPRYAALLPAGERPLLTFRVGYPTRPGRPTPRRSARAVTR